MQTRKAQVVDDVMHCSLPRIERVCLNSRRSHPSPPTIHRYSSSTPVTRSTPSHSRPSSPPRCFPILYGRRLADRPTFVGRRHGHPPHRKPAVLRNTRRSRPLASRASVWTTSLFRKGFTFLLYIGPFRSHCALPSLLFALDFPPSISVFYFTLHVYQRTSPHLHHPRRLRARCRAPYYDSVTLFHFGHRCSHRLRRRAGLSPAVPSSRSSFHFPPLQLTLPVEYLSLTASDSRL